MVIVVIVPERRVKENSLPSAQFGRKVGGQCNGHQNFGKQHSITGPSYYTSLPLTTALDVQYYSTRLTELMPLVCMVDTNDPFIPQPAPQVVSSGHLHYYHQKTVLWTWEIDQ